MLNFWRVLLTCLSAIGLSSCGGSGQLLFEDAKRVYAENIIPKNGLVSEINLRFTPVVPVGLDDWLITWVLDDAKSKYILAKNEDGISHKIASSSGYFMVLKSAATPTGMLKLSEANPKETLKQIYGNEWEKLLLRKVAK